jgi:AcrR family transcriptional regulator
MTAATPEKPGPDGDAPRGSKGQASRATILNTAAQLATSKGLTGLSIGDLAAAVGMSKSGLYAHFKSKDELELATIETAAAILEREVLEPAARAGGGTERLFAVVDAYLSYLARRVFPGGCFFAAVAAELDTRPGPARDRVVAVLDRWLGLLRQCVFEAVALGEIDPGADVAQAVFEIEAALLAANFLFVMLDDPAQLAHGRRGVENVLARLAAKIGP